MENLLFLGVPKLKHVTVIENVLELNVHYFTDSNFLLVTVDSRYLEIEGTL